MSDLEHGDKDIDVDPTVGAGGPGEGDPGWVGGGGPASTIDDVDPTDDESHLEDTDHSVP
jgi:hypothetical protein